MIVPATSRSPPATATGPRTVSAAPTILRPLVDAPAGGTVPACGSPRSASICRSIESEAVAVVWEKSWWLAEMRSASTTQVARMLRPPPPSDPGHRSQTVRRDDQHEQEPGDADERS